MVSLVCVSCGKPNNAATQAKSPRCAFCGEALRPKVSAQMGRVAAAGGEPAVTAKETAARESKGVRCTSCGKVNPVGREDCLRCDNPLPAPAEFTGQMSHATAVMRLENTRKNVMAMRTLFLALAALEIVGPVVVVFLMNTSLPWEAMALAGCFVPFLLIAAWKVVAAPVPWSIAVAGVRTGLTVAIALLGVSTTFLALNVVWTVLLWMPLPVAIAATRMLSAHPELLDYWKTGVLHPELLDRVSTR